MQSGIRNTLSSDAAARNASIIGQQQATQDWTSVRPIFAGLRYLPFSGRIC